MFYIITALIVLVLIFVIGAGKASNNHANDAHCPMCGYADRHEPDCALLLDARTRVRYVGITTLQAKGWAEEARRNRAIVDAANDYRITGTCPKCTYVQIDHEANPHYKGCPRS